MFGSIASSILKEDVCCQELKGFFDRGEEAYRELQNQIVADFKTSTGLSDRFCFNSPLSFQVGKKVFSCSEEDEVARRIEAYRQSAFAFVHQYSQELETCTTKIKSKLVSEFFKDKIERTLNRFSPQFFHYSLDELRQKIIQIALNRLGRGGVTAEDVFYLKVISDEKMSLGFFYPFDNVKFPAFEEVSLTEERITDDVKEGEDELDDFLILDSSGEEVTLKSTDCPEILATGGGEGGIWRKENEGEVLAKYRSCREISKHKWKVTPELQSFHCDSEQEEALFYLSSKIQELNRKILSSMGEDVQSYQLVPKSLVWIVRQQGEEKSIQEIKITDEHLKQNMGSHRDYVVAYCFAHKRFKGERFFSLPNFDEYIKMMSKNLAEAKLKMSLRKIKKIAEEALKGKGIDEGRYRQCSYSNGMLKIYYTEGVSSTLASFDQEVSEEERYSCLVYDVYQSIAERTRNLAL